MSDSSTSGEHLLCSTLYSPSRTPSVHSYNSLSSAPSPVPARVVHLSPSVSSTMGVATVPVTTEPPVPTEQVSPSAPALRHPLPPKPARIPTPSPAILSVPPGLNFPRSIPYNATAMERFLSIYHDNYGHRQSVTWMLTDIGKVPIDHGITVAHRICPGLECYAVVGSFVARGNTEALFRMKLIGWQTPDGWHEFAGGLTLPVYLLAPLSHCAKSFSDEEWEYFACPYALVQHTQETAQRVRTFVGGNRSIPLPHHDFVTASFLSAFKCFPLLKLFSPGVAAGLTVAIQDLHTPINDGMVVPPVRFPSASIPMYQYYQPAPAPAYQA
ncbi:unnamed protein product [Peniophora sp. CBMAI 1063]|nr:unnamed protein product [Peniophora sp. CBMAI 1063]